MHIGGYDISGLVYAAVVLIVALFLYKAHRDPNNPFDLTDLLKVNGRVSKIAVAFLTTLFTSSWYVVHEALEKQLTDAAFAAYLAAWVAPIVAAILKGDVAAISSGTGAPASDAPTAPAPAAVIAGGKPTGI
jgi:hypothetical protein